MLGHVRFSVVLVLAALVMIVGTGCLHGKIVVLGWPTLANRHDFKGAAERFAAVSGIEVDLSLGPSGARDYIGKIMMMQAAGQQVDVVTLMPHWGLPLVIAGGTTDLTPYMQMAGIKRSDYAPATLNGFEWNGELWGLPLAVVLYGSSYNKRILAESGFAAPSASEWTWDTVIEMARRTTIDRSGDGVPDQLGVDAGGTPRTLYLYPLFYQAGGLVYDRFVDPQTTSWTKPHVTSALEYYLGLFTSGYAPLTGRTSRNISWDKGNVAFQMLTEPTPLETLDRTLGHREVEYIPAPRGPVRGGMQIASYGVSMSATSKFKTEAWKFMEYMSVSKDEIVERYRDPMSRRPASYLPNIQYFLKLKEIAGMDVWHQVAVDTNNTPRYSLRGELAINNAIQSALLDVVNQKVALPAAVENIQRIVQSILLEEHAR